MTTQTRSSKSFILCPCVKIICAEQAKVHFIYFALRDQHAVIIPKQLPHANVFVALSSRRSFLNSLLSVTCKNQTLVFNSARES